jgi:ankyrin repeat protein
MKICSFLSRFFHSPIARLSTLLLIMLPWSVTAFSQLPKNSAPVVVSVPTFGGPIHAAAKSGDLAKVKELLKDNPNLISSIAPGSPDDFWVCTGGTPLHWAVLGGQKDVVEFLLDNGADVNFQDIGCNTPLHMAAYRGYKEIAALLLARGAEVNAANRGTPLHWAARSEAGQVDVAALLIAHGAKVNAKDSWGNMPLHNAADIGNKDMVNLLMKNGAEINVKNHYGETPLRIARMNEWDDVVELLRQRGGRDINKQIKCKITLAGVYETTGSNHKTGILVAFTPSATKGSYDILQISDKEIAGAKTIKGANKKLFWIQATGFPFLNDLSSKLSLKYAKLGQLEAEGHSACIISISAIPDAIIDKIDLIIMDIDPKGNFKAVLGTHEEADQEKYQFNKVAALK